VKEQFTCFAVHPDEGHVVTSSRNLMIRRWDSETCTNIRSWKGHDTHVSSMEFDPTGTLVATGGILMAKVMFLYFLAHPVIYSTAGLGRQ
jgi:WD40 repeat protein